MRELITSIDIEGTPEMVWATLMDFDHYPGWNPFVVEISGRPVPGERLAVNLRNPGGKAMSISPRVMTADENREFSWLGKLGIKGIFDGHHHFQIEPTSDGTIRFTQSEEFSGILIPLLWKMLNSKTRAGFEAMNAALKDRVEGR